MKKEPNRTKLVEKKVFGMLIESSKTLYLSVQAAYSLEEAFFLAKLEFERIGPKKRGFNDIVDAKISLFSVKSFTELENTPDTQAMTPEDSQIIKVNTMEDEMAEMERLMRSFGGESNGIRKPLNKNSLVKPIEQKVEPTPEDNKNALMHLIIKSKDSSLLEEHRNAFTESEIKYIEERLK